MLSQFKIVSYGRISFSVICREEWKDIRRNTGCVKMMKKYGPVQEGDTWRIRSNEELNRFIKGKDIVKFIKAQRIRWLGQWRTEGVVSGVQTPPPPKKFQRYRCSPRSHEQEEPASRFPFAVHCVLIRLYFIK